MPAPPVVAPTIVALDDLHQELSAVSADVAHDSFHATVPSAPLLHVFVASGARRAMSYVRPKCTSDHPKASEVHGMLSKSHAR